MVPKVVGSIPIIRPRRASGEIGKHASLRGWCLKKLGGSSPLSRTKVNYAKIA